MDDGCPNQDKEIPGVGGCSKKRLGGGLPLGLSETLTLNQIQFSCILQPCTKQKTKNPNPIPDGLFSRDSVTITEPSK